MGAKHTLPRVATLGSQAASVLTLADMARLKRYQEYMNWYNGQHWTKKRLTRSNLVLNYCRTVVDKGVSYLLGDGLNWSVRGPDGENVGERGRRAEALLYRVYDDNYLGAVDVQAAINGAVLGDTVFKVYWDLRERRVRVVNQDPARFFCAWAEDDLSRMLRAHAVYWLSVDEAEARYGGTFKGSGVPTLIGGSPATDGRDSTGGTWVVVVESWTDRELRIEAGDREVVRGPNPYGFIPFVHIANARPANEFWGVSDLRDLVPLNQELNERFSDMADVIRFHSDPPVVFKGVSDHTDMVVGPGTVWDVPEDADVFLLEWRGQQPATFEHIDRVMRALHDIAETPKTAFGETGRIQSGRALEIELQSLIQRTTRKRAWWTAGLRQRSRMVLRLSEQWGGESFGEVRVRVIWAALVPSDAEIEVRNNVELVNAGLRSRQTAMDRLGEESPEEEMRRIDVELPPPAVVREEEARGEAGGGDV